MVVILLPTSSKLTSFNEWVVDLLDTLSLGSHCLCKQCIGRLLQPTGLGD